MSEKQRADEVERRKKAQDTAGDVVAESGRRGSPRRMAQMVSVRLDGELVVRLRDVAEHRGVSISELLREGAEAIVRKSYAEEQPRINLRVAGAKPWSSSYQTGPCAGLIRVEEDLAHV